MRDKPRIFVSSAMESYSHVRDAARRGIETAGGAPILVENFPALASSPRNACLDLVQSSDGFILIIGKRGGFRAPSGKLVVEEEYEEARRLGLPIWVFIEDGPRDADARTLADRISAYVTGHYRRTFKTTEELEALCRQSLEPMMASMSRAPFDPRVIDAALRFEKRQPDEPQLRLVLAPAVRAEVVDPLMLDSEPMRRRLMGLGHETDFLSYEFGKQTTVSSSALVISEAGDDRSVDNRASMNLTVSGLVVLDKQISPVCRFTSTEYPWAGFEIVAGNVSAALTAAFRFGAQILETVDPHHRYPSWFYNVALGGLGPRRIVDTPTLGSTLHAGLGLGRAATVTAFDEPRQLTRPVLAEPQGEIDRAVRLLRKRAEESSSPF